MRFTLRLQQLRTFFCFLFIFLWNLKAHALVFYYVLATLFFFGPVIGLLLYLYGFIFSVSRSNVTNVWLTICRFFFFYSNELKDLFIKTPRVTLLLYYRKFYELCFCFVKKIELASWIHLFQRRFIIFHISFQFQKL